MKPTNSVLAAGVSLSLVLGSVPAVALADEPKDPEVVQDEQQAAADTASEENVAAASGIQTAENLSEGSALTDEAGQPDGLPESSYDKADFYQGSYETAAVSAFALRSTGLQPREISKDMLYFGAFEGGTYDCTFSYGDGYHAMGYYQFDHRYGLKNFLLACYNYNPSKYSMFAQFANVSDAQFKAENAIRSNGAFTALGNSLIRAWKDAYAADSYEFSRLQDDWAYTTYYLPAERYLASRGIDISDRNDAVKGLCWGLSNLFGQSGWRKFVGGVSDGYDWNGVYHSLGEGYQWPGCGLSDDMTDREFVTALCNYVVDNVAVFYKAQPQYHAGWQNRYKKELNQCLTIIDRTGDTHAKPESNDEGTQGNGNLNGEVEQNGGSAQGDEPSEGPSSEEPNDGSSNGSNNESNDGFDDGAADGSDNGSNNESAGGDPGDDTNGDTNGEPDGDAGNVPGNDESDEAPGADNTPGDNGLDGAPGSDGGNLGADAPGDSGEDANGNASDANAESAGGSDGEDSDKKNPDDKGSGDSANDAKPDDSDAESLTVASTNADADKAAPQNENDGKNAAAESEKPKKISEMVKTSDGLGTLIASIVAAMAALVVAGVVVFRMKVRRH